MNQVDAAFTTGLNADATLKTLVSGSFTAAARPANQPVPFIEFNEQSRVNLYVQGARFGLDLVYRFMVVTAGIDATKAETIADSLFSILSDVAPFIAAPLRFMRIHEESGTQFRLDYNDMAFYHVIRLYRIQVAI